MLIEKPDIGNRFRVRVTATNADGSATAVSDATREIDVTPEQNVTYCPPAQGYGIIGIDEIKPPARLEILQTTSAPAVITRSTQRITLRVYVRRAGRARGTGPRDSDAVRPVQWAGTCHGCHTITLTRQRYFPAMPRQQNLIVFVSARKPGEDLLGGISNRRLVSLRVRLN